MQTQPVNPNSKLAPAPSATSTWEIDPTHSSVGFGVRHLMVSTVRGEFTRYTGTVVMDEHDVTRSKIDARIEVASITTRDEQRDGHLKSPDFFDVEKFPLMTFSSKRISAAGDGLQVVGELTLHGVTREVTLTVERPTDEVKDPYGNVKRGVEAHAKLNRKDFGLKWNAPLEGGGLLVGDEVKITLELELVKKSGAAPTQQ